MELHDELPTQAVSAGLASQHTQNEDRWHRRPTDMDIERHTHGKRALCLATEACEDSFLSTLQPSSGAHAGQRSQDSPASMISTPSTTPAKLRRCTSKQPWPVSPSQGRQPHAAVDPFAGEAAEEGQAVIDPSLPPDVNALGECLSPACCKACGPQDRVHYKSFHKSLMLWFARSVKKGKRDWNSAPATWKAFTKCTLQVQTDFVEKVLGECRLNEPAKKWASDWTKAGNFVGVRAGRPHNLGTYGGGMMVRNKKVLLTFQGDFWALA